MLLYIHIPFCDSKCHYCSFNSYVDKFSLRERYMKALAKQLHYELERFGTAPKMIETMFIGGGTPSTVMPHLYAPLFEAVKPYLKDDAEVTSEANPNSATKEWLEGMKKLGVNRISFGVQSFDDRKLKRLGRAHNSHDARRALWHAKEAGLKHLSLDLIYGVENDTVKLLEHDLEEAFFLPVDHLSAYALTIEEDTPFASHPEVANEKLELTKWLFENIAHRGFKQYEISNFGTYRSLHNMGYWQYKNYIGLGSGAVGFKDDRRFYPDMHIESYIDNPLNIQTEILSKKAIKTEKIFLGLRHILL
ncbi:MAG: coproporphyrinogen III oxidase [Helicobacteraceae bacterium 4484_230]|nr:MAG: coproporphyrinogen III oxidase [Helicobacteraceae bacterium 4484_230]